MLHTVGQAARLIGVGACLLMLAPLAACGDDEPATPTRSAQPKTDGDDKPVPASKSAGKEVIEFIGRDGKKVAVPKESLEKFLEWRNRKGPDYAVNSVALEGTADETRARLTATITVQVLRDDEWLRVPLFLNEAVILETKHEFLGSRVDAKPGTGGQAAFSDRTRNGGYRWWFRGRGYHRLKLTLVAPIAKSVAQRRLRLQLPPLSAASTLQLRVPDPNLTVVPQRGTDTRTKRVDRSASEIRVAGLGSELDLQWRSIPRTQGRATILQSQTAVFVDFTVESVVLTALQSVQPLGGSIERFEVQLPAGFQARAATGTFVKSFRVDARNRATVELAEPRTKRTEVKWTLDRPLPAGDGKLTVDGFDVVRGRIQTGEIAVAKVQGLRVVKADADNSVSRIQPGRFSAPDLIRDKALTGVYTFFKQPFRLNLSVSRMQPHITVEPTIRVLFDGSKLRLVASFHVRVSDEGAAVEELQIQWPGRKTAGWTIDPLTASPLIDSARNEQSDSAPITLKLAGQRSDEFDVYLSAERTLTADEANTFRLPVLKADVARPTTLVVERTPNVVVDLTDRGDQPLTAVAAVSGDAKSTRRFQLDAAAALLTARVKVYAQRIVATTVVELRPTPAEARWSQRIKLHVEYVPLSAVRLDVPPELVGRVRFLTPDGRPIVASQTTSRTGKPLMEIQLPRPQFGTLEWDAVCSLPLPSELQPGRTSSLLLPLIRVAETGFSEIQVREPGTSPIETQLPAEVWRRLTTLDGTAAWVTEIVQDSVPLKLHYPEAPRSRAFGVRRALVRSAIDPGGVARCRGQYRIVQAPDAVVVTLASGLQLDAIWWGTSRIDDAVVTRTTQGTILQIPIPASQTEGLLTIDYHSADPGTFSWIASRELVAPRFPGNIRIEETAWQVSLPADHHLSSFGSGFFGEFRWVRNVAFWERQPTADFAKSGAWIGAGDGPVWTVPADANTYFFRRYGPADSLALTTMSRSLIVLIGAGIAWLIGILMVKFRRLRGAAVLLTAGLLAAVAGLWFAAELQLILQPALLGTLLVAGYVWIDRIVNRRRGPAVITVADPSDFVINSTQSERPAPVLPESDEGPTTVRGPTPQPQTASDVRRPG